jgi:hypothetical protein
MDDLDWITDADGYNGSDITFSENMRPGSNLDIYHFTAHSLNDPSLDHGQIPHPLWSNFDNYPSSALSSVVESSRWTVERVSEQSAATSDIQQSSNVLRQTTSRLANNRLDEVNSDRNHSFGLGVNRIASTGYPPLPDSILGTVPQGFPISTAPTELGSRPFFSVPPTPIQTAPSITTLGKMDTQQENPYELIQGIKPKKSRYST